MTNVDLSIQKECTVSGVLSFVLHLSKIFGLAPLKFKRVHDGWRIRVSHAANLYGKTITYINCIMILIALILDFNVDPKSSMYFNTSADTAAWLGTLSFLILSLVVATYSGISRMQCMITSLAQLQKVNTDLSKYGPLPPFKTRILYISSFCAFFAICVIFGLPYLFTFLLLILRKSLSLVLILDSSFYLLGIMNKLLILQVTVILATVPPSFSHLNNCLATLLRRKRHQCTNDRPLEAATVNHLRSLYDSLFDVIQAIDRSHGAVLVQIIPVFLTSLVTTVYKLMTGLLSGVLNTYGVTLHFVLVTIHMTQMLMVIEPCHLTYKQMDRTKHLIGQLLLFTPPEHHKVIQELELFYKHLINDVFYTPLGVFFINRPLIVTIVGGTTAYLVVIVNL